MNEKTRQERMASKPVPSDFPHEQFQRDLVALIPDVRAFSRLLCKRRAIAEDLAQEALAKAWRSRELFEPGTNMKSWLFTILRNTFYTQNRRGWRETSWDSEKGEAIPTPPNEQEWAMNLSDAVRALYGLTDDQREAILLVAVAGLTYDDAGRVCGRPGGTMKSRVARGRASMLKMLDGGEPIPQRAFARAPQAREDLRSPSGAL